MSYDELNIDKMYKNITWIVSLFLIVTINVSHAQSYTGSIALNSQDSSYLTASCLTDDNFLITASIAKRIIPSGGTGFPQMSSVGEIVLRKLDLMGNPMWEVDFPSSIARITHVKVNDQNDIIISGGFRDSLTFQNSNTYYAENLRLNAFIASYSSNGVFKWAHVTDADPSYSRYYYNFDFYKGNIYAPFFESFSANIHLHVLNMQGDSVNDIPISEGGMLISEMEFHMDGNLYICGTSNSLTKITGNYIGNDSTLGYTSFIAKLDTNFQHVWSYSYEYITADYYPQMALNSTHVAFIVDTLPVHHLPTGNHHQLTFYNHLGQHQGRDSIGGGVFNKLHENIALEAFAGKFVLIGMDGWDTLSVLSVDSQFNYSKLARIQRKTIGTTPFFVSNDSLLILNHTFFDSIAIINDTDIIVNPKHTYPYYTNMQQFIVVFGVDDISTHSGIAFDYTINSRVYPNPSSFSSFQIEIKKDNTRPLKLEIYSSDGSLLDERQIPVGIPSLFYSNASLQSGLYYIVLKSNSTSVIHKWIRL